MAAVRARWVGRLGLRLSRGPRLIRREVRIRSCDEVRAPMRPLHRGGIRRGATMTSLPTRRAACSMPMRSPISRLRPPARAKPRGRGRPKFRRPTRASGCGSIPRVSPAPQLRNDAGLCRAAFDANEKSVEHMLHPQACEAFLLEGVRGGHGLRLEEVPGHLQTRGIVEAAVQAYGPAYEFARTELRDDWLRLMACRAPCNPNDAPWREIASEIDLATLVLRLTLSHPSTSTRQCAAWPSRIARTP
jgi:hypothetical protein